MKSFILASLTALAVVSYGVYHYSNSVEPTNTDRLSAIVKKVNSSNTTWTAGHNSRFQSKTEIKEHLIPLSIFKNGMGPKLEKKIIEKSALLGSPEEFDSATQWPECESLKEVRDQSACGSCWAFGAVEAMSDRICIHSGQKDQRRVSAEDLLTCCGWMTCGYGCDGGFPEGAWQYWKESGIVTGGLYGDNQYCKAYFSAPCAHHTTSTKYPACPDSKDTPSCSKTCDNGDDYKSSKTFGKSAYSLGGEHEIKTEISTNGPVETAFTVYEDFETYTSGIYQHVTGDALGGHAVKMVGYGVEDGVKYWKVANSWNETWGDNGYFRIIRGTNHCGIEDAVYAGMPQL